MRQLGYLALAIFLAVAGILLSSPPPPESTPEDEEVPEEWLAPVERARAMEARGALDEAVALYLQIAQGVDSRPYAEGRLRAVFDRMRAECQGDPDRLAALVTRWQRLGFPGQARLLAQDVLKLSPDNERAREILGYRRYRGEWALAEEIDLIVASEEGRRKQDAWERMTPRQRMTAEYCAKRATDDRPPGVVDLWPNDPWVVIVEDSEAYSKELVAEELGRALADFRTCWIERFGAVLQKHGSREDEPMFVYVYEKRERFMENEQASYDAAGFVRVKTGEVVTHMELKSVYETIAFFACQQILQVLRLRHGERSVNATTPRPFWLLEGIPSWFECTDRDHAGGLRTGRVSAAHVATLRRMQKARRMPSLEEVLELTQAQFHTGRLLRGAPREREELVSYAWAFVHFLETWDGGRHRGKLDDCVLLDVRGMSLPDRVAKALGDVEPLQKEFDLYLSELLR